MISTDLSLAYGPQSLLSTSISETQNVHPLELTSVSFCQRGSHTSVFCDTLALCQCRLVYACFTYHCCQRNGVRVVSYPNGPFTGSGHIPGQSGQLTNDAFIPPLNR